VEFPENKDQFENKENFEFNTEDKKQDDLVSENRQSPAKRTARKRKNKNKKVFVAGIAVLFLLFVFVIGFAVFAICDINGYGGNEDAVYIDVAAGTNLKEISAILKEKDIISNETVFYLYARDRSADFKAGMHLFNTSMSYEEICDSLCEIPHKETVKVLIPEGYELRLIAQACEEAKLCTAEEFMDVAKNGEFNYDFLVDKKGVAYKTEGFLFPATYEFEYGTSAYDIIDKMLYTFDSFYTDEYSARAKELGMTDYEVVTLASVVEREAASAGEHKKVAGVFYNRINIGMKLESCATVQYVLKERKPVLSIADTKIDSPYNTYKYAGLPVGPVASPSLSAIEGVLYPEEHDYYFFVAKSDGSGHIFSKTLEEHNRAAQNR